MAQRKKRQYALAIAIGAVSTAYAANVWRTQRIGVDFDQLFHAARAVFSRNDPYQVIGLHGAIWWPWPFFYPLTAAVITTPFALLPLFWARIAFVFSGAFVFALALVTRGGTKWRWLTLLSKPYQTALVLGQPSTFLAAMFVLPWVSTIAAIKPNISAAIGGATLNRRVYSYAIGASLVVLLVSLVLQPRWPAEWFAAARNDPFGRPAVLRPFGVLLILAALKWRQPEARLLLALSLVPQTLGNYDALVLFLIPRRPSECIALLVLSHFGFLIPFFGTPLPLDSMINRAGDWTTWCLYLPCLAMVLTRPNRSGVVECAAPGAQTSQLA